MASDAAASHRSHRRPGYHRHRRSRLSCCSYAPPPFPCCGGSVLRSLISTKSSQPVGVISRIVASTLSLDGLAVRDERSDFQFVLDRAPRIIVIDRLLVRTQLDHRPGEEGGTCSSPRSEFV